MGNRYKIGTVGILLALCLSGCESTELEQRSFPLAAGVDLQEDGLKTADTANTANTQTLVVSYDFPDLKQVSEKSKTEDTPMGFSIEGRDLYHVEKAYENNTNRILDYNHLKALVLGKNMFSDMKALRDLLGTWEQEQAVARNTTLFLAEPKAAQILSLTEETEGSVGKYLEEMTESQKDFRQNKIATAGSLMNQWHNQDELLLIPVLTEEGNRPVITKYALISDFGYVGDISVENAMEVFLSQNLLEKFVYEPDNRKTVEITDIKVEKEITGQPGKPAVTINITGNGVLCQEGTVSSGELRKLEQQVEEQLVFELSGTAADIRKNYGVDITNSYISLGGYNRELYGAYQNRPDTFGKEASQVFHADIQILNWK